MSRSGTEALLIESTRRLVEAWPTGFREADLRNDRWNELTARLEDALLEGDPATGYAVPFRVALLVREAEALLLFAAHRLTSLEAAASQEDDASLDAGVEAVNECLEEAAALGLRARHILTGRSW